MIDRDRVAPPSAHERRRLLARVRALRSQPDGCAGCDADIAPDIGALFTSRGPCWILAAAAACDPTRPEIVRAVAATQRAATPAAALAVTHTSAAAADAAHTLASRSLRNRPPRRVLARNASAGDAYQRAVPAPHAGMLTGLGCYLARDADMVVRTSVAASSESSAAVAGLLRDPEPKVAFCARRNPRCPAAALRGDGDGWHLADHSICASSLARLAEHHDVTVRRSVAANGRSAAATLAALSRDEDPYVRSNTAANPATDADTLDSLSRDSQPHVRVAAARNLRCRTSTLAVLAADPDESVAAAACANPSADAAVVMHAARSRSSDRRAAAARNPRCWQRLLIELCDDDDAKVRAAAARRISRRGLLDKLAADADRDVRASVAASASCPPGTLAGLASDADWLVRAQAARNPRCTLSALLALTADPNHTTAATAAAQMLGPRRAAQAQELCPGCVRLIERCLHAVAALAEQTP